MNQPVEQITIDERHRTVLHALRQLDGRATVGDVVTLAGVPRDQAEQSLRELLGVYRGHVAVGDRGDLLYAFDPALIRRDHESWWARTKRGLKRFFSAAFKGWIVAMLTAYFVVFVAILLAAIFGGRGGNRGSRRGFRIPTFWIWYLFWTRGWRFGRPYYGHRRAQRDGETVPFYKKVFAFVFGPDTPVVTEEEFDRRALELIRARRGVLSPAERVEYTGMSLEESSEDMARLMGRYAGDVRVSSGGELAYIFPELMVSARGPVRARPPEPAWRRLERARTLTGNPANTDRIIAGMNGFNLLASATAPWTFLGTAAPAAATIALVAVPVTFSTLFFAIPLVRKWRLDRENRERQRRNIRKALLSVVFQAAVEENAVTVRGATMWVQHALSDETIGEGEVADGLQLLAVEFDAAVETDAGGVRRYRFPRVRQQLVAAEELRSTLALDAQRVGDLVYSTGDSPTEAARRDLAAFDAELRRTLPAPGRAAFADD